MAFLTGWDYRKKLTIDSVDIDSTLTDFPVLVKLTSTNFDFTKAKSNGEDIRFTSSDGQTLLKFERENHISYGSDVCTGGTASASSINGGETADKAFDDTFSTWWTSVLAGPLPAWLKYDLGVSVTKIARKFTLTGRFADGSARLTDFKFQGSNDDSIWTTLHSVVGETWSSSDNPQEYTFSNSTAYRYYRLYITDTSGGNYAQLREVEIMEESLTSSANYWVKIPSVSSSIDTDFYIYYGNTSASDTEDVNNVWDSNFKTVMHLKESGNGTVDEYIDSTSNNHHGQGGGGVGANVPTQVDGQIFKGQDFDGLTDLIEVPDSVDWDWGTSDLTFSFWIYFDSTSESQCWIGRATSGSSYFYFAKEGSNIRFRDYDNWSSVIDWTIAWSPIVSTWYRVEVVRNGSTFQLFIDKSQQGSNQTDASSFTNRSDILEIGNSTIKGYRFNGIMDEFRMTVGLDRGSAWRNASYESEIDNLLTFNIEESPGVNISETATLNDNWQVQTNPGIFNFNETAILSDSWNVITNQKFINIVETATISDNWNIDTSPKTEQLIESTTLDDTWTLDMSGDLSFRYNTDLRTTLSKIYKYMTNLVVNVFKINKYDTNLTTKIDAEYKYNTNLRVKVDAYDDVSPGNLNDIIVKLDGSELTDVDYSTLRIQYNLNTTPSFASFQLARRHDNLDYLLDGVTSSIITNENKIEIYDGTYKLLTAYITQITGLSRTDTVAIVAEDIRYKLSRNSMEIEYGGKIEQDENDLDTYNRTEISIGTAISQVLSTIGSYVSGYEGVPFSTTYTPEYTKTYGDLSTLLNQLVTQTANVNWYIDENEYLRFQKVDSGTIKELALSSLSGSRHVYDVILSDVTLNKQKSGYAKSLNVKLGQHIIQKWSRRTFTGWLNSYVDFFNSLKEKTSFVFQQWGEGYWKAKAWYCGVNKTIYGYNNGTWVLKPTIVVQHQSKDSDDDLADITVGSGSPQKTIHLNSYGKKETSVRWEEEIKESDDKSYLIYVQDDEYDHTAFAQDFANFDLSQNNKLQTSANITLLLNAYKYYNIKLKDRINLSNTINTSIYKNNNEFPLNVDSVSIDCSTRIVTLNLTNYGKSWGVKTGNYLTNTTIPKVRYVMEKQTIIRYDPGL